MFQLLLEHELLVTASINNLVDVCLQEKDYSTHNFIQWYVSEQLEEEALAGMYIFDRDLENSALQLEPSSEATLE